MKAIKKIKTKNNVNAMGLLNPVKVELNVSDELFNSLKKIMREKKCTKDDLINEALVNYANGFNKPNN